MARAIETLDVVICGSGSAGLCAGLWLSRCGIKYKILEHRDGPLSIGQADGVQTRTVEIFESFNLSEELLKEAYHVLEVAFWTGEPGGDGIRRTGYAADVQKGLSHQPHVILNQARINGLMIEEMQRSRSGAQIEYGIEVLSVEVDATAADDHCVEVTAHDNNGHQRKFRCKYALACDGAHSTVRKSLGFKMIGDSKDSIWGVMDVYPRTTFPDIRKKTTIHAEAGDLMIIPREGDEMVRFYIELGGGVAVKDVSLEDLHLKAQRIFYPYKMEIAETAWWSAYAIGQRLAESFTLEDRVFLTGDACHTHSPKAGQGMNVSLQDGYNIGWKLAAVLHGQASPTILKTYISERHHTASELINFDRYFTKLFSSSYRHEHGITPEYFQSQFVKSGRYTAGQGIKYESSLITSPSTEDSRSLAAHMHVGMRFPSAQVVRFCDAKAMQLVKAIPADGRWTIMVFAGDISIGQNSQRLGVTSEELKRIVLAHTRRGNDADSLIRSILVLSGDRKQIEQEAIPGLFTPISGHRRIKSLLNTFVDDESYNSGHGEAYKAYGIDPKAGCIVVIRPDHYISMVCCLNETQSVKVFFEGFMSQ